MLVSKRYVAAAAALLLCTVLAGSAAAQDMSGRKGLTASLQSDQLDVMLPWWLGARTVVAPGIQYVNISDAGSDLGLGLTLRRYLTENTTRPYFGVRAAMLTVMPENGDSVTDHVFGALFGGEHFFDDGFSFGIEAQLNISVSDEYSQRFGNADGTNINTATSVSASIYF